MVKFNFEVDLIWYCNFLVGEKFLVGMMKKMMFNVGIFLYLINYCIRVIIVIVFGEENIEVCCI